MLLPALSKAKESARNIACLNNIEQIGLASNICSDDRDGHVPTFGTWLYRRSRDLTTGTLYPYLNSKSVYISPTDKIELASKRSPKATSRAAAPSRERSRHARPIISTFETHSETMFYMEANLSPADYSGQLEPMGLTRSMAIRHDACGYAIKVDLHTEKIGKPRLMTRQEQKGSGCSTLMSIRGGDLSLTSSAKYHRARN